MTEHCVSDIGIPNGEPFNIYITRMLVVKSIFVYAGYNLDWKEMANIYNDKTLLGKNY